MERALFRFDGCFGDNVGGFPFGGNCVRSPSLRFWAGCGGSAFEVGIIVSPPASETVLSKDSFREWDLAEIHPAAGVCKAKGVMRGRARQRNQLPPAMGYTLSL